MPPDTARRENTVLTILGFFLWYLVFYPYEGHDEWKARTPKAYIACVATAALSVPGLLIFCRWFRLPWWAYAACFGPILIWYITVYIHGYRIENRKTRPRAKWT